MSDAERLARITRDHISRDGLCGLCGVTRGPWPCDAAYLLAELLDARARLQEAEGRVEGMREGLAWRTPDCTAACGVRTERRLVHEHEAAITAGSARVTTASELPAYWLDDECVEG